MHALRPGRVRICFGPWRQCAPCGVDSQTLIQTSRCMRAAHAKRLRRPRLRAAAARAPGRLRERGAPSQLHPRRRRVALTQSAVSRQVLALEDRLGVPLFRRLHRALALTEDGATLLRRDPRSPEPARPRDARDPPQRAGADRRGHDDAGLRRPLADPAPGELRRRRIPVSTSASRPRNALVNLERDGVDIGHPLSAGANAPGPKTAFACSARPSRRCAARACCARRIRRWRGRPISPRTRCCAWSPTAATSCRTGASGCRR